MRALRRPTASVLRWRGSRRRYLRPGRAFPPRLPAFPPPRPDASGGTTRGEPPRGDGLPAAPTRRRRRDVREISRARSVYERRREAGARTRGYPWETHPAPAPGSYRARRSGRKSVRAQRRDGPTCSILAVLLVVVRFQFRDDARIGQRRRVAERFPFGDVAQQTPHDFA